VCDDGAGRLRWWGKSAMSLAAAPWWSGKSATPSGAALRWSGKLATPLGAALRWCEHSTGGWLNDGNLASEDTRA
jgi:hypothetical protein